METMFKTWTVEQAATPAIAIALCVSGKEKKMSKFRANYIENNLANEERTKRRYPNSTSYCSLHRHDIKPNRHSGNCTNRCDAHNELATINMLGDVTTKCFRFGTARV